MAVGRSLHAIVDIFIRRTSPPKGPRLLTTPLKTSTTHTRRRLVGLVVIFCLLFATVVVKLANLQVLNPKQFQEFGMSQRVREEILAADRGTIFDRNGVELALSLPQKSVFVDPKLIVDPPGEAQQLGSVLGIDPAGIEDKMRKDNRFSYVARFLDESVARQIEALSLPGVAFVEEPKRYSPSSDIAGAVVGGVDPEGVGIAGLEKLYTTQLAGTPGKLMLEQSPSGRTIPVGDYQFVPATKGDDLVLTLDRSMQFEVQRMLTDQVSSVGAKGGVAIVTKPDTGEVLASVSVTKNENNEVKPDGNFAALTTVYEPGSVMKLATVSGAIEDKKVDPDTVINLPTELKIADATFTDAEERGAVAWPVKTIIEQSSNIGTILIGQRLGRERIVEYMKRFGFDEKTGINFPGEQSGVVPPLDKWWATTAATVPIGQGVSVTPMQMLAAYNVIANGGVYISPKLVQASVDANGVRRPTPDPPPRTVVSLDTANKLNVILRSVVAQGTGTKAAVPGYTVGGKTGTSRKPQPGGGYEGPDGVVQYQATFVGFAPAEAPKVSVLVMIDEPAGGQIFGGLVAAPVFSKITEFALKRLGVPPPVTDAPAGGVPADSEAQAKKAMTGASNPSLPEDTLAVETLPDGRVRGVPAGLPPGGFIPMPLLPPVPAPATTSSAVARKT
ncbi:MAG: penicillin-binding protein 2 [Actinobacteria bacterium]|nr:penicillin-binding protein 2 [Actinomycetota bacterium]